MEGSDLGTVPDPSIRANPFKKAWGLRSCEGDVGGRGDSPRRIKMRDLDSILHSEGTRTGNVDFSMESMAHGHRSEEEGAPRIEGATSSMLSDKLMHVTTGHSPRSLEQDVACFTSGHAGTVQSSANQGYDAESEPNKVARKPCFSLSPDKVHDSQIVASTGLGVDLNTVGVSSAVEHNPFHPYKKLGQVKPTDASECGSTTGPLEEGEPLRMWKKMKQNGFLSSSHGGIPLPKQHVRQPRKRKDDEAKKKAEAPKREQANRFAKVAAPSGLFSRLHPGLIKHVRNSKQVHSIIEAMVRSEMNNGQVGRVGGKETNDRRKDQSCALDSTDDRFTLSLDQPYVSSICGQGRIGESDFSGKRFHHETSTASQFTSEFDDDALALKLSSAVTMGSDNASSASGYEFSGNHENIPSLSLKAATVACQWLELLQLDIKGRLAALRRSKKRVRNVIQTELPYLLSTELSSLGTDPCSSSIHVARWKSLFSQMDKTLFEEAKHLESWLKQVQEMQMHCEKGLKFVCADGLSQSGSSDETRRSKKPDEMECAVMAAAASIYSTCSLIMTKGNVPCF